jgi:hypothetical protein
MVHMIGGLIKTTVSGALSAEQRWLNCRNWLRELMKNDQREGKSKAEFRSHAVSHFGVSRRAFDRTWNDCIKATGSNWNKPGRPKSKH